ncbi:MAG: HAD hydrolase-like protein, partial [Chloroflexi bacterium]|nr:HAD hydrolase-like protein [Chloroflexota bacterium]
MNDQLTITGSRGAPANIDAVVFDFDDTIADTLAARVHAMGRTFALAGIEEPTAEAFITQQRGVPLQVSLGGFEARRGLQVGMLNAYRAAYWMKEP